MKEKKMRKLTIEISETVDGGFQIRFSTGVFKNQKKVAETVDNLCGKVTASIRAWSKDESS